MKTIAQERMKRLNQSENNTQLWMCLVMEAKVRCCKEQCFIGTWNVRSINQGKLEVVNQEIHWISHWVTEKAKEFQKNV